MSYDDVHYDLQKKSLQVWIFSINVFNVKG